MRQFGKIFNFELKYYLKNKVFVGVTLFLVIAIAGVMFFPRIMGAFENGEEETTENVATELSVMLVKAESPEQSEMVKETFGAAFTDYEVQSTDKEVEEIKDQILSGDVECAFVMTGATSILIM